MTGCNNKRRFSLKYPDGRIERYGSCDPKIDDGRTIMKLKTSGGWFMSQGQPESFPDLGTIHLDSNVMWTNGYYDHEHDGWKRLEDWA